MCIKLVIVEDVDVLLWCPRVSGFARSYICSGFLQLPFFFECMFLCSVSEVT